MKTMFQTTSRAALIALIAAAPMSAAYAQSATQEAPAETEMMLEGDAAASGDMMAPEAGASDEMASDEMTPEADTDMDMAADTATGMESDMTGETTDMAATEEPVEPVDGQITMQDSNTILAQDLLGATVYNDMDENVGDISDFIISMDGNVEGVVIGVGGFLGLGEKDVAIEMAALDVVSDDAGNPRLVTSATQSDLEAAPEFISNDEQDAEMGGSDMMSDSEETSVLQ